MINQTKANQGFIALTSLIILSLSFSMFLLAIFNEEVFAYQDIHRAADVYEAHIAADTCQRFVSNRYREIGFNALRWQNKSLILDDLATTECRIEKISIVGQTFTVITSGIYIKSFASITIVYNLPEMSIAALEET